MGHSEEQIISPAAALALQVNIIMVAAVVTADRGGGF